MRFCVLFVGLALPGGVALGAAPPPRSALERFLARYDRNGDGFVDQAECPEQLRRAFARLDQSGDGKLSRTELRPAEERLATILDRGTRARPGSRPGEVVTPAARSERQTDRLRVGDPAPDFNLPTVAGTTTVQLSRFRGKKPVVLIFASYT